MSLPEFVVGLLNGAVRGNKVMKASNQKEFEIGNFTQNRVFLQKEGKSYSMPLNHFAENFVVLEDSSSTSGDSQ